VLDGIVLEKAGVPSASIVTDVFELTGRAMAEQWGVPAYRFLLMPHPIANLTEAELDQRARENGLFALCEERDVGVIVRTPLCFGFLAGKVDAATVFDPADHRNRWGAEQRERWAQSVRLFVAGLSGREVQTPAQVALRFCLSFPAVSTVIPGMLTAAEVAENARASDLGALAPADLDRFAEIYRSGEFFLAR